MACVSPLLVGTPGNTAWVRCGACLDCLISKSASAKGRSLLEAHGHLLNCAVTLTYDDDALPDASVMSVRDGQLAIRRLRRLLEYDFQKAEAARFRDHVAAGGSVLDFVPGDPSRIRYCLVGEFGRKTLRWHYHLLIFGWCPPELLSALGRLPSSRKTKGLQIKLPWWPHGHAYVDLVTPASAGYVHDYFEKGDTSRTVRSQSNGVGRDVLRFIGMQSAASGQEWSTIPLYVDFFGKNFPVSGKSREWLAQGYDAKRRDMGQPVLMGEIWPEMQRLRRIISNTVREFPSFMDGRLDATFRKFERYELKRLLKARD